MSFRFPRSGTFDFILFAAWHGFVLLIAIFIPSFVHENLPWRLPLRDLYISILLSSAYSLVALIALGMKLLNRHMRLREIVTLGLAALGMALLSFIVALPSNVEISEQVIVMTVILLTASLALENTPKPLKTISAGAFAIGSFATAVGAFMLYIDKIGPERTITDTTIRTSLTTVQTRTYQNYAPQPSRFGGALATVGPNVLLTTGIGRMFMVREQPNETPGIAVQQLSLRVPLNYKEFNAAASQATDLKRFRVSDLMVRKQGDSINVFAMHHHWNKPDNCYTVRVSRLDTTLNEITTLGEHAKWYSVYDSEPCLGLRTRSNPFSGQMVGGRIAPIDFENAVISVGDMGFDGTSEQPVYSQMDDVDYGKILTLNLETGEHSIFSKGHRNQQGLTVDSLGRIWSTEHGPEGGDELNLIEAGENYGWPYVTFGTAYGSDKWSLSETQGRHPGYKAPAFAWVPSIGTSNVIELRGEMFPMWQGDLLVSSLVSQSVFRVRIEDERPIVIEPVFLDYRVRDVVETASGRLLAWTDSGRLITVERLDGPLPGEALFQAQCMGCHQLGDGVSHGIGPDLDGVFRRTVASAPGYSYTEALQNTGGTWSAGRLDQYLEDPGSFASGTSMVAEYTNLEDEKNREAIIRYLQSRN